MTAGTGKAEIAAWRGAIKGFCNGGLCGAGFGEMNTRSVAGRIQFMGGTKDAIEPDEYNGRLRLRRSLML